MAADALLSDRVMLMEADGRTYTVQHTLFSDALLATLSLPGSVVPQRVAFGGPERQAFQSAWEARSDQLALRSGSAFARYRHQYGDEVEGLSNGIRRLRVSSFPPGLTIEMPKTPPSASPQIELASTWVFPSDVDVLDWQADAGGNGQWTFEDNSLGWQQQGAEPVALTIVYRSRTGLAPLGDSLAAVTDQPPVPVSPVPVWPVSAPAGAPMSASGSLSGALRERTAPASAQPDDEGAAGMSADEDDDGVPDAVDVCLGTVTPARIEEGAEPEPAGAPLPGCEGASRVVLEGIGFDVGQSRLDESARRALDRIADALVTMPPGQDHEIAAHTDSQGRWFNNLALSQRRARAVRQYLLLRGVPAGSLSATGHGESRPIGDNLTAQGRRANRRIELGPLSPSASVADQ